MCFMGDPLSPARRSWLMGRVKTKNTAPELVVRSLIHRLGYRFRLHYKKLPGNPDLAFPAKKKVIFVHGCFWHRHDACHLATTPKTRAQFWEKKFKDNKARDGRVNVRLNELGWSVLTIWQCELKNLSKLVDEITIFLDSDLDGSEARIIDRR